MEMLQQIFQVCIIPLLGILTAYLIIFIRKKMKELKMTTENEMYLKYLNLLEETIVNCVIATNQTYVEELKEKNAFDAEAQKQAFIKTYEAVMSVLTEDAKKYLSEVIGDLDTFIIKMIEAQVKISKED